jgi:excisionase family DNA binding protein
MRAEDLVDLVERARAEDLPRLIGDLEAAKAAAFVRLTAPAAAAARPVLTAGNVSVEEAAKRLGVSPAYVYKNASTLPFVVRIGRRVLCDSAGLDRWARQRPGGRVSDAR